MQLDFLKNECLVFDIETYAEYKDGKEVNIQSNFDDYVSLAKVKWVGFYSFRNNQEYYLEVSKNRDKIFRILDSHKILIGFNSEEFDHPILKNNNLIDREKWYTHVDCMKILGSSTFKDKKGFKFKGRGNLMGYKFKRNSLECMSETMKLKFNKSKIDYLLFKKVEYSISEKDEITKYLKNDILSVKEMFEKLWTYWMPFTTMLNEKNVNNLSWIRSSIASLIYKSVCHSIGTDDEYIDSPKKVEEMGGRVIEPKYEEAKDVWYIDFSSLYPHIFCMFNLFDETVDNDVTAWHGNEVFKVNGYYNVSYQHQLSKVVQEKLIERIDLQKSDPKNPMIYTLKIWLNGLYGIIRSPIFKNVHTSNAGWDCCWLGQQIHKLTEDMMEEFGFECIAGDTDSLMLIAKNKNFNNKEYVKQCLNKVIQKISANVPFSIKTFNIKIEHFLPYILFPFSDEPVIEEEIRLKLKDDDVEGYIKALDEDDKKIIIEEKTNKIIKKGNKWVRERRGKKKNYMYIYDNDGELDIELVGLPLKKDGATPLGLKIYNEILKNQILQNKCGKFSKEFIDQTIENYLKDKEIMKLLAREFKIKPFDTYKIPKDKTEPTGIHAQISKGYFNSGDGVISLIKNTKVGKAGKGFKYCSIKEAIDNKLTLKDLELEKLYNELEPFVKNQTEKEVIKI